MKTKIQVRTDYESDIKGNPIKLLLAIKQHALSYESSQYCMKTICDALKSLINLRQKEDEDSTEYLERYKAAMGVFLSHVDKGYCFPKLVEEIPEYEIALQQKYASSDQDVKDKAAKKIKEIRKKCMDEFYGYL